MHIDCTPVQESFRSLRASGTVYRSNGVGLRADALEQLRGNAWYRFAKLQSDAHRSDQWKPAAPRAVASSLPDYHPVPLHRWQEQTERQQREDEDFVYRLQQADLDSYFSRN